MAFVTYGTGGKPPESYKRNFKNKDLDKEYSYEELWDKIFHSEDSPLPKPLTSAHRIVVVDADAIVYRISAACEKRSIEANLGGKKAKFKNKTGLKQHCQQVGIDFTSVEFEEVVAVEPVENAYSTIKKTVAKIYRELNATHVLFFLGGSYNFRTDLKLPTKYKDNRKTTRRPQHLYACREYLNKYYDTFVVSGIEADDCVQGITEYIINRKRAYACAYQLDKDFHTSMTRNRYWHIDSSKIIELKGGLGRIELVRGKVKGEGLHWILYQLMQGDASDGYSPKCLYLDHFKGKYGDSGYFKDFGDINDARELLIKWVDKWENLLPENIVFEDFNGEEQKHNWLSLAELYFQCLYMRMSPVDDMTFEKLLGRYGLCVSEEGGHLEDCTPTPVEEVVMEELPEPEIVPKEDWEW